MAEKQEQWVYIQNLSDGKLHKFSPERRNKNPDDFQGKLKTAWDTRYVATCGCDKSNELRLYIRKDPRSEKFALNRFPHTGSLHNERCKYYCRLNADGGANTYSATAVSEDDDNMIHISLAYSLTVNSQKSDAKEPAGFLPPQRKKAEYKLPAITLLGLLSMVWKNSGANTWNPVFEKSRKRNGVMNRLLLDAAKIRQGHTNLSDVLLLQDNAEHNHQAVMYGIEKSRRLVVIAELQDWNKNLDVNITTLPLIYDESSGLPYLNIDQTRWNDTLTRFNRAAAWWRKGNKTIVIAVTDVPSAGKYKRAKVRQACLMMVSERWIPLDSSYEGTLEKYLVSQRRSFIKPLLYDAAEDEYHPDFILTDAAEVDSFPLEVWGMESDNYVEHRKCKVEWYNTHCPNGWWEWDAVADPQGTQLTPFPRRSEYYENKYPLTPNE